jgi:hypothetical protein
MVKQFTKNSEEQESKAYRVLVGKAEGKRLLRSLRCRLQDSIKIYLEYTG